MAGSMNGPWAKYGHAESYFNVINDKCRGHVKGYVQDWIHRYTAVPEAHSDGLEYRFYVEPRVIDAEGIALLTGDFLFNLRSSLDHLVYELTRDRYGRVPTYQGFRPSFVILDERGLAQRGRPKDPAKWREIKDLSIRKRQAILHLQPYNRRHDKYRRIRQSLLTLNTLCNIDKHRHLHVVQAAPFIAPVGPYEGRYGFQQKSFFMRPLVGKTEAFRWTFDSIPPDIANQVNRKYEVTAAVTLDDGGEQSLLVYLLQVLLLDVRTVLERFERVLR